MLFGAQFGRSLTADDAQETLISTARALQMGRKYMTLKSISKSQHIIGNNMVEYVTDSASIPDMLTIVNKSYEELRNLTITQV